MIFDEEDYLAHYGILRRSGRYPWGSGGDAVAPDSGTFLSMVEDLKRKGLSEIEVAQGLGITTSQLRNAKSIAKNEKKQADIGMAQRLHDKGWSNVKIGERMGIPESSVRALLAPGQKDKADILSSTTDMLKAAVKDKKYVDVGAGAEYSLAISNTKLKTAIAKLKEEGYDIHYVKVPQLGTGQMTTLKVLVAPHTPYSETYANRSQIKQVGNYSEDGGRSYPGIHPPLSIDSKRLAVRYAEQGGTEADGVIYVRPGVSDLSLGSNRYAQVRVAIDGTHFLKGMAVYKDDLPDGVDLMFNTNKSNTGNKLDALKTMKSDKDLPFGAVVRQLTTPDGKHVTSAMNLVNDEADWEKWSKTLSSQMLSKQSRALVKSQLDMTYEQKRNALDQILKLTNPVVKQKLLLEYSDSADAAAVHLKAAHMPRQKTHVILPVNSMKETEVYAPNYDNGERVVLVRFPHGGTFEIPELTVNNRNPEAKKLLGQAQNAIGIHSKVAQRLSGADFDGDTVLVIPNNEHKVQTSRPLEDLKGFDPQHAYPAYEGMPKMSSRTKGIEMGKVSNLITDMTIKGASTGELARAVKHSMVVIDAEKHNLNYKQSAIDNGISQLMEKYQGRKTGGASTIISRKKSEIDVNERKSSYTIDPKTGKKIFKETGATYLDKKTGKLIVKQSKVKRLLEVDDAHELISDNGGTPVEKLYAEHSNHMKVLANEARRAAVNTKMFTYSPSAKKAYATEVAHLDAMLNIALRNAPLERQAQVLANAMVAEKQRANPDMEAAELKKIKGAALTTARTRVGAGKKRIEISDSEWDAIQAGAISPTKLREILKHADPERVKQLAMPKSIESMSSTKTARAKAMLSSGYTQAEVAQALGVSVSTIQRSIE